MEEERARMEEARKKQLEQEAEARRIVEEQAKKKVEEEYQKRLAEERERLAEEQRRQYEEERKKIEEEARRKVEEDQRRREEEERLRAEEEGRKALEEERIRREEEEAERRRQEEETRQYEEAVRQAIEEGRRLAQAKKIRAYLERGKEFVGLAQFEEALKEVTKVFRLDPSNVEAREFEQTVYAARDEFARREEEARALQEEQRRKVEELQRKLAEQARMEEELQQQRAIREAKIAGCLQKTRDYIRDGMYDKALTEIETVYAMDPGNAEAREYEQSILTIQRKAEEARSVSEQRSQQGDAWRKEEEERQKSADEGREGLRRESMNTYRAMMRQAWAGGEPVIEDRSMLDVVRLSLGIPESEHKKIEHDIQIETYTEALRAALRSGAMSVDDVTPVEQLRKLFSISKEDDRSIQSALKAEFKNDGRGG